MILPSFPNDVPRTFARKLLGLSLVAMMGVTSGCGKNLLVMTDYLVRDVEGRGFGTGTGGGGTGYDPAAAPKWPVQVTVSAHVAENSAEEVPIIALEGFTVEVPQGSACTVSREPDCAAPGVCGFTLEMKGPGPCVVRMNAETREEGTVSQCFSYTLTPSSEFEAAGDRAFELCGD